MNPSRLRALSAALIFLTIVAAFIIFPRYIETIVRFLHLPPVERMPGASTPKDTVEWAQEVLRTSHQLVSYMWVLGAIGIGAVAAVSYYFFTWAAEHREILKSMASWQATVERSEALIV